MKIGDIIYHEELIFSDGVKDEKKHRPCIFLYEQEEENKSYTYSIPLTSNIDGFNKYNERIVFIPEIIYRYRTLSFAKIGNIIKAPSETVVKTEKSLSLNTILHIIDRIIEYKPKEENIDFYKNNKETLKKINTKDNNQKTLK